MIMCLALVEVILTLIFIFIKPLQSPVVLIAFRWILLLPIFILIFQNIKTSYTRYILASFLFIGLADTLIDFYIHLALLSFSISHIVNIVVFSIYAQKRKSKPAILVVMLFIIYLMYYLVYSTHLHGIMSYMVILYMGIIVVAAWKALSISMLCYIGYLLFVICDLQVAFKEFISDYPYQFETNSIVYYAGLFLIGVSVTQVGEIKSSENNK